MGSDTGQFVHNRPDIFGPFRDFQPHRLFDTHTQGVTVHMGRKVIQPVGQCQSLGIGEGLSLIHISGQDSHHPVEYIGMLEGTDKNSHLGYKTA